MIDLIQAFLVQKQEMEMRSRKTEHLYWDLPPLEPWFARVWRSLRSHRQRPAPHPARRTGAPSWGDGLDAPRGETAA